MLSAEDLKSLEAAKSASEWNRICDDIKRKYNDYPSDWFEKVVLSGLADRTQATW